MYLVGIDGIAKERLAGCFIFTAVFAIAGARILGELLLFGPVKLIHDRILARPVRRSAARQATFIPKQKSIKP